MTLHQQLRQISQAPELGISVLSAESVTATVTMQFRLRVYFICAMTFVLFTSFKILEPEIRSTHPAHDNWLYDSEHNQRQDSQLPVANKNVNSKRVKNQHDLSASKDKPSKEEKRLINTILGKSEKNSTAGESKEERVARLLKSYDVDWKLKLDRSPWLTAAEWVTGRHVHPDCTPELGKQITAFISAVVC